MKDKSFWAQACQPELSPAPLKHQRTWINCKVHRFRFGPIDYDIPVGFQFDGASIPRILWRIITPMDTRIVQAALIHDWLYRNRNDHEVYREEADWLFYKIMLKNGMSKWKAWSAYQAVRKFGWMNWK